ncbi:MAG: hypothetical protein EXR07_01370 [Acetobacteraceae bacterium]|nr:hypothetical protein [Acetobacteraceae bacterium]
MTDQQDPKTERKKTPTDASDFEREQLRLFLSEGDLAATLATINPSLAWLPVLSEMKLIQGDNQIIGWIERNFSDEDAVRDVVANIGFFSPETANFLEFRLNREVENLPPVLAKCWQLIIRHIREAQTRLLRDDWFELEPLVLRGDHSAALLERIAQTLRPKLKLGKRISFYDTVRAPHERPWDLMSIDFEVQDGVSTVEFLQAWSKNATAETDLSLLAKLTSALEAALADAADVGVEGNKGNGTTDHDVPSVAHHVQNTYRSGFHAIVRVMAELWLRLARKSPQLALPLLRRWCHIDFRLMRRLVLFACADPVVSSDVAADMLIELPRGELFLTSSSVEVFRLIRTRWPDFAVEKQRAILRRLCEGPPRDWFREGVEIDQTIDRSRFDILAEMERDGLAIGGSASDLLNEIRTRWPTWRLRPAEQAGFHVWHESSSGAVDGGAEKLTGVPDSELVAESKKLALIALFIGKC